MRRAATAAGLLATLVLFDPGSDAQVRPIYDRGAAGLTQLLQQLTTTASALHTGAHPDDEDSAFIARTARGDHARVAYLSLNRGEGGQNIIGPELFDALGVIRTEELLQARRLDGGEQFFTRAFDFGFSKTRAETASLWNEQAVLEDMVRVIRAFRPLVIYARFSGTGADGHGHHQMAGHLTPIAFKAAADPSQFPSLTTEGLRPWQARKLYSGGRGGGAGGGGAAGGPVLQLATGVFDPALGRSYAEIAAEGRSQHKSQQMGGIEPLGPANTALRRIESITGTAAAEQSIFDGIDITLQGLASLAGLPPGSLQADLAAVHTAAVQAQRTYRPLETTAILAPLADGLSAVRRARAALPSLAAGADAVADADFLLAHKEREFTHALVRAAGVVVDPLVSAETIEPGGNTDVTVRVFAASPALVRVTATAVQAPQGWRVTPSTRAAEGGPRRETPTHSASFSVAVPPDAPLTQPYYLATPRKGAMYDWPASPARTHPFDPPLLTARVTMDVAGMTVTVDEPVTYRTGDSIRGELRRNPAVVPSLAVGFESPLVIVPTGTTPRQQRLQVHATSLRDAPVSGSLSLRVPTGWTVSPAAAPFSLQARGARASATFTVVAPARRAAGSYAIDAQATANGLTYDRSIQVVEYPHIQTHRLYAPARLTAQVLGLSVAPVRVGYIMGSGDEVPAALRRMGVEVTLLDDAALAGRDLSAFDTIVVGIRAAETRPALAANQSRLRQFMERGGALIVQYQQQEYISLGLPPFPAQMAGNSRVTNEAARVSILQPAHPVFTYPNRITDADFAGWVQERNLYAFTSFDARYTPLLAAADPDEALQRGGQVYARVGRGHYVYTAYAWFRQLPAGVPGAYRQFANLISLPKAPSRAGSPATGSAPQTREVPVEAPDRTRPSR